MQQFAGRQAAYSMIKFRLFNFDGSPWSSGLRILAANFVVAVLCVTSFFGVLAAVTWMNERAHASGVPAARDIPFPFLSLLACYAVIYFVLWVSIARRLPTSGRPRLLTAFIGASPLFGLSLLGYLTAAGEFVLDMLYNDCRVEAVYGFGFLATVVLLAGLASVAFVYLCQRRVATDRHDS
jgi:hypothetical protein